MKRKLSCGLAAFLLFISSGAYIEAAALNDNAYTVSNTTYYVNPGTGTADDGGDTSTGEGMCRNATYPASLYEVKNGKHTVTVRLKLISFISDIHFSVQQTKGDADSYKEVPYTVTGENTKENTKDFLIPLSSPDVLIKPQFFVGPMNRDVTYFVELDMDTAKLDEGSFAAFNKAPEKTAAPAAPLTQAEESPAQAAPAPEATSPAAPSTSAETVRDSEPPPVPGAEMGVPEPPSLSPTDNKASDGEAVTGPDPEEVAGIMGYTADGDAMSLDTERKDKGQAIRSALWPAGAAVLAGGIIVILVLRRRWK